MGAGWSLLRSLTLVLLVGLGAAAEEATEAPDAAPDAAAASEAATAEADYEFPESDRELAWEVYQTFQVSCAECHSGGRPKARFGHILDLPRLAADDELVMPGEPEESRLLYYLTTDDEFDMMPPADSDVPRQSAREIAAVREWIARGARITDAPADEPEDSADPADPDGDHVHDHAHDHDHVEPGFAFDRFLGQTHPLLVHFPIAMLLGALVSELLALLLPGVFAGGAPGATRLCLWIGTLGAGVAILSGWVHVEVSGDYSDAMVFDHRWLGVAAGVGGLIALVLFEIALRCEHPAWRWSSRAVVLITDGRDTPPSQMPSWVDPVAGAHHAAELDVNLYAIGVGDQDGKMTDWQLWYGFHQRRFVDVLSHLLPDMQRLEEITDAAGGMAMRAGDREQLESILDRIDRLEPSPHEVELVHDYHDRFALPLLLGLVALFTAALCEPRLRGPL